MKRIPDCSPLAYHRVRFDGTKLPDVIAAGPVSSSVLADMRNPWKVLQGAVKGQTDDMIWGNLVDCLWLTPDAFEKEWILVPATAPADKRRFADAKKPSAETVASIQWWNEFDRKAAGKTPISEQLHADACEAVKMLFLHPVARKIWEASDKQVVFTGDHPYDTRPADGSPRIQGKMMIDLLPRQQGMGYGHAVADLKQTHDISEHGMKKACHSFQYPLKMAHYLDGLAASGDKRHASILIFQQSIAPFEVKVRELSVNDIMDGQALAKARFEKLSKISRAQIHETFDNSCRILPLEGWQRREVRAELYGPEDEQ